jgi:hypothetical protein
MADNTDTAVDDGVGGFGGEKLRQHQIQENALPDKHANSTGHETSDDKIVGSDFSGLEKDPTDMAASDEIRIEDDGLGPTNEDEDEPGLPEEKGMDSANQSVTQYDQTAGGVSAMDVDETAAGGLQFPDDDAEEQSR